ATKGFISMATPVKERNILLIDDDSDMHLICKSVLEKAGYDLYSASGGFQGSNMLKEQSFDLILLDFMMPDIDGFTVLQKLKQSNEYAAYRNIPIIMLTVLAENHPKRKRMLEMGLSLFLNKPFGHKELINIIENVFVTNRIGLNKRRQELERLRRARGLASENRKLRNQLMMETALRRIVGTTETMQKIFERVRRVALTEASVLITGESGTGKELIARAIHECSKRAKQAFVPVDCVALPASLLESELFGFEKGAFTGAMQSKRGLFEEAHQGTFFLDEIGELSPELQAKLLRVLQERQFRHLGGKELIDVDIRVVAATNRNPLRAVEEGILREDLYYRLNVVPIHLPPLRERRDDIPLLIQHFLKQFCEKNGKANMSISDEAIERLTHYGWPGNIRELQNVVERMVSLAYGKSITIDDLPGHFRDDVNGTIATKIDASRLTLREARMKWMEKFEKRYLLDLLKQSRGNISLVARKADVNRMTIYRMLKKYNIKMYMEIE
ncbi:MAG: sigma-54-dependent transcriptional regulator, partial [bacterium]